MLEIAGKTLKSQKTCKAKKKNTLIALKNIDEFGFSEIEILYLFRHEGMSCEDASFLIWEDLT